MPDKKVTASTMTRSHDKDYQLLLYHNFVSNQGGAGMDNRFERGQIVVANDKYDGEYIGQFVDNHKLLKDHVYIKILACTTYPSQKAIIYAHAIYERRPFDVGSVHVFEAANVKSYEGSIPDYYESVDKALDKDLFNAREHGDLDTSVILRKHRVRSA
jgi:hypothetical protein